MNNIFCDFILIQMEKTFSHTKLFAASHIFLCNALFQQFAMSIQCTLCRMRSYSQSGLARASSKTARTFIHFKLLGWDCLSENINNLSVESVMGNLCKGQSFQLLLLQFQIYLLMLIDTITSLHLTL